MTECEQFALDSVVSPAGVIPGHAPNQHSHRIIKGRTPETVGRGPLRVVRVVGRSLVGLDTSRSPSSGARGESVTAWCSVTRHAPTGWSTANVSVFCVRTGHLLCATPLSAYRECKTPCLVQNVHVTRLRGRDIATVPNLVSIAGLLLTVHGARRLHTPTGIAEVTVGRLLDLVDGYLARALDQSSQFGAGLDAIFDKAGVTAVCLQL